MGFLRVTWRMLWLCALLGVSSALWAAPGVTILTDQADFGSAQYREDVVDLEVKVLGGSIRHQRHLDEGWNWQFNPAWSDLELVFGLDADPSVDAPSEIKRHRVTYRRRGQSSTYVFHERQQIVRTEDGFRWEDRYGNAIDYDPTGRIVSYNDRNGVYVYFIRDTEGRVASVEDHHRMVVLTLHYRTDGKLERVEDYTGREVRYTYHPDSGLLTEVHDVLGGVWRYDYRHYSDIGHLLTKRTDPEGNAREIDYTIGGGMACVLAAGARWAPVIASGSSSGGGARGGSTRVINWAYMASGCLAYRSQPRYAQLQRVSDAEGTVASYNFFYDEDAQTYTTGAVDGAGGLRTRTYNKRGEIVQEGRDGETTIRIEQSGRTYTLTDTRGNKTIVELDEWRNVVRETYSDGTSIRKRWDPRFTNLLEEVDENGVVTRHDYDSRGNRIRTTEALGLPEQRIIEYEYDGYGNNTAIRVSSGAYSDQTAFTFTHDAFGNVTSRTDAEGHVTHYLRHDVLGNVLEQRDARGNLWQYGYDDAGNRLREETPLGFETRYEYDKVGNLVKVTDPAQAITTLTYDERNRLIRITNPLHESTSIAYDGADRPIAITDALGHTTETSYTSDGEPAAFADPLGEPIRFHYGAFLADDERQLDAVEFPTFTQQFRYDARNRVISSEDVAQDAVSRHVALSYDAAGNLTTLVDPLQHVTEYGYDGLNRITRIVESGQAVTQFAWDHLDSVTRVENARGIPVRRFGYDSNGLLVRELLPDDSAVQYSYDPNGNLATLIDAEGRQSVYRYDADNRLVEIAYYDAGTEADDPDAAMRRLQLYYDKLGQISRYIDDYSSATYSYDDAGRLLTTTVDFGSFKAGYAYTYYANGQKRTFTGPDGVTYSYRYDANGRLIEIDIPDQGVYSVNEYNWLAPAQVTLPGGGRRQLDYDGFLRPSLIEGLDPASNPVHREGYVYDTIDNVLERNALYGSYEYAYDEFDRLVSAYGPVEENHFSYDLVFNRLSESEFADGGGVAYEWQYDEMDRLLQRGPITYAYDVHGNLILKSNSETGESLSFRYTHDNELSEVRDGGGNVIARYRYDLSGRRVERTVRGVTTYYLYADEGLIAELDQSGRVTTAYGYEPDTLWGVNPLFIRQGEHFGYYHIDQLGVPRVITSSTGRVLWSARYTVYGEAQIGEEVITNNLRLPGQYYDAETGFHYNWNRYYYPATGRYITMDPWGLDGGINGYAYAFANPIANFDNEGLFLVVPLVKMAIGGVCSKLQGGSFWGGAFKSLLPWKVSLVFEIVEGQRKLQQPDICERTEELAWDTYKFSMQRLVAVGAEGMDDFYYRRHRDRADYWDRRAHGPHKERNERLRDHNRGRARHFGGRGAARGGVAGCLTGLALNAMRSL